MVKLSKTLPLLAIVAGFAGSAFTSAQQNAGETQQDYTFISVDTGQQFTGTRDDAKAALGCPDDEGTLCATAEDPLTGEREPEQDLYKP